MDEKLLLEIQQAVNCNYLSDLRVIEFSKQAKQRIRQIPQERYPLEEWRAAVGYLTGKSGEGRTVCELKEMIDQYK